MQVTAIFSNFDFFSWQEKVIGLAFGSLVSWLGTGQL